MKIKVKPDHIRHGVPRSSHCCPIACALKEQLHRNDIAVLPNKIQIGDFGNFGNRLTEYRLPKKVQTFIRRFDKYEAVGPFDFELNLK